MKKNHSQFKNLSLRTLLVLFIVLVQVANLNAQEKRALIPLPVSVTYGISTFEINEKTNICYHLVAKSEAKQLQTMLQPAMGYALKLKPSKAPNSINLRIDPFSSMKAEGYTLTVTAQEINIVAANAAGLYWGCQTLRQLLPSQIYLSTPQTGVKWTVAEVSINDYPRFGWRGMMLDCSRQFFDANYIKKYIDWLAVHKINVFHWHLTDDQGWRIEIKKYPMLTSKGAWRGPNEVLSPSFGSGENRYGGFYTQAEIKDIVKYATERHVNILPEIDIPGHSRAVTASYPETLCQSNDSSKSVQGEQQNVWCAGREENFKMLEDIFGEVASLFPFDYIHIGGDEVNKNYWNTCANDQKLMKDMGMTSVDQVQNYFINRIQTIISKKKKKMLGWNEIMEGGNLNPETCVMAWTGIEPGIEAAKKGHPVVMAPGQYCYFDMAQARGERGHWWAGIVNLEKVYSYDPLANQQLTAAENGRIFGIQGALWSEYLDRPANYVDYQTYPRLCAMAEAAWTPQSLRRWSDFNQRISSQHYERLANLGIDFRVPPASSTFDKGQITIVPPYQGAVVRYTTDGTEPTEMSSVYSAPFASTSPEQLRTKVYFSSKNKSNTIAGAESLPFGTWDASTLCTEWGTLEFPIEKVIYADGYWHLVFKPTKGNSSIEIRNVVVLNGNDTIASDLHLGLAGSKNVDNMYVLAINATMPLSNCKLKFEVRTKDGAESLGNLMLLKSEFKEPVVKISSNLKVDDNQANLKKIADWNRNSVFTSVEPAKEGDYLLFEFKEPIFIQRLEFKTGIPGNSRNILTEGALELSENGTDFIAVSGFTFGIASANPAKKIKSIRVKVIGKQQEANLTVQDLLLW
jgi:hexosaminidase